MATPPFLLGVNDHDLMWSSAAVQEQVIGYMVALGIKVHRCDLYEADLPDIDTVSTWVSQLKAAGIQPLIPVTFSSLINTGTAITGISELCAAVPGLWLEWGNELDSPYWINMSAYVSQFSQIVLAVQATDPTAKIGCAPVSNINAGGSGWVWKKDYVAAGGNKIPVNFDPIHDYVWPGNVPPLANWAGGYSSISLIPQWQAAFPCKAPTWITEAGYPSLTTNSPPSSAGVQYPEMTPALQSQYIMQFLQNVPSNIPVVVLYELGDGGGQVFGLMTAGWLAPKPIYTALAAAYGPVAPPVENYQQLWQTDQTHIRNRIVAWQNEAQSIAAWLALNTKIAGRAEVSAILGWLDNQVNIEQNYLKNQPVSLSLPKEKTWQ